MQFSAPTRTQVSDLSFDLQNPRLVESDLTSRSTEAEVLQVLWDTMDVRELVLSIAASGFFQHEPLMITEESSKKVVIEGNRRLAAVKVLLDPSVLPSEVAGVPQLSDDAKEDLRRLPTISGSREDAWRYIGFKHVNGPAKWSSYAKSEYITRVYSLYHVSLDEIARQIGDTHKTVQRLFRGMMVINQAEEWRVFSRDDRWHNHFSFSHLYTGIDYPGISTFLGLSSTAEEDPAPVPDDKKAELGELCSWLYGSKRDNVHPLIESQNPHLKQLNAVLEDRAALSALRSGRDLRYASELSRPVVNVFEESIFTAKRSLEKARGLLSTAYDGSKDILVAASDVMELASDLYDEMDRKSRPAPRRRSGSRS